jgi:DNA-binding NarL/FixJ family response regulator
MNPCRSIAMRESIRVLLVDDHMMAREGLAAILRQEHTLDVVGEASDGRMAIYLTEKLHPDVVVMDVRMPLLNGIEATRQIKLDHPGIQVIGFTMHSEVDLCAAMQKAGAAACISKSAPIEALIETIRDCCPA